ncbi:MAG: metallophosphoesterase [Bacteroidales bacterium]
MTMYVNFRRLAILSAVVLNLGVLSAQQKQIVLLHTNDTHSQIEPNPATASSNADEGGIVRRAAAIERIRKENPNVILVDAGDFLQGSPYYNFFKGEVEVKMMNKLGYQIGTLGNHEFDNGIDELARLLALVEYPVICANYDVTGTVLEPYVKKTAIIEKAGVKIGFIGIGTDPEGLIAKKNFGGIKYLDPVKTVNKYAKELKDAGCEIVVVVSHVGYYADEDDEGDREIAVNSTDVDLIIGGHSHTDLKGCVDVPNMEGKPVRITQTGKSGFRLGRVNIELGK